MAMVLIRCGGRYWEDVPFVQAPTWRGLSWNVKERLAAKSSNRGGVIVH
jgi:hypothetical protein